MQSLLDSNNINFKQKNRILKSGYQCIYLVDVEFIDHELILKLTGSTLNIYTVKLKNNKLKCNCQDSFYCMINKLYCKHLCFVIIKIGQLFDEDIFYRDVLNNSESFKIYLRTIQINDSDIVCEYLIQKYKDKKNLELKISENFNKNDGNNLLNECPICYECLKDNLVKCPKCSNCIHRVCAENWLKYNKSCVFCRSEIWNEYKYVKDYLNIS